MRPAAGPLQPLVDDLRQVVQTYVVNGVPGANQDGSGRALQELEVLHVALVSQEPLANHLAMFDVQPRNRILRPSHVLRS